MRRFVLVLAIAGFEAVARAAQAEERAPAFAAAACEGIYPKHLQGICADGVGSVYWSFTDVLVKSDARGKVEKKIPVASHHGDLCYHDGKVLVAVNLGRFNDPQGNADSWVYVYNAADLSELARHKIAEAVYGAGGIAARGGRFFVVGGLPPAVEENYVYEYDQTFRFVQRHVVRSGYTLMGIQTAAWADGYWWFGCYGDPKILLKTNAEFEMAGRYEFDCSLGVAGAARGRMLVGRGSCRPGIGCTGRIEAARPDDARGLVVVE
ncbi:MAG: hypothetical protein HUU20_04530 [Pirellulales bacterium]|nr:hypothetical protein [Pirellulales bacterium]